MSNALYQIPTPKNEPIHSYAPETPERRALQAQLETYNSEVFDIPMIINGEEVRTNNIAEIVPPHNHKKVIAKFHRANRETVTSAIEAALQARNRWAAMPWQNRAAIFLKAADLISGPYRYKINAATMLGQGKNCYQSEIDSVCEYADFLRFNVKYMEEIYKVQPPENAATNWNQVQYRGLEGFVAAVTPFNFTAIAGNLCASPAMMGNVVVWKPADTQIYSAKVLMEVFDKAGLPPGVINVLFGVENDFSEVIFAHPELAGVHFTGSTTVFRHFWKEIGKNIDNYKSYPRIVGETGGKDFVFAHPSADPRELATALLRGAFEYSGQKCSAASRAYIPESIWSKVSDLLKTDLETIKVGPPEDFSNFINAVIDRESYENIKRYVDYCRTSPDCEILMGGKLDDHKGFFVHPTVIQAKKPDFKTMCEEIFGPVLTVYVYPDSEWKNMLETVDQTSPYALTGAIFSKCRYAIEECMQALENSAGNFYINDKPTGAVVGQQPFGGARASGTNDKAGMHLNLLRWTSVRSIKECFVPPTDYRYPFLG